MTGPRASGVWLAVAAGCFFPFAVDNFELPHQLVLALGACLAVWRRPRVPAAVLRAVALVGGLAVLTTVTSLSWSLSLGALVTTAVIAAFAVGGGPAPGPLLVVVWPICGWAWLQRLGHDVVRWSDRASWCGEVRPFSTLGHPTQLGVWLALLVPLALEEAARAATARRRGFAGATALVAAVTCGLTLSRAGWLALAVGVVAWLAVSRVQRSRGSAAGAASGDAPARSGSGGSAARGIRGASRAAAWVAAGAALAALLVATLGGAAVLERVTHFFVAPTRLQFWATALDAAREHPLLGWGLDTFVLASQQFRPAEAWRYEWGTTPQHAHSLVPQALATQGLVGLAVLAAVAVVAAREAWRGRAALHPGFAAVAAAFVAASTVTFSGVAVAALGAVALAALARPAPAVVLPRWAVAVPLAGLALTVTMLAASVAGRVGLAEPEPAEASERLRQAAAWEPWNGTWHAQRGAVWERAARRGAATLPQARLAFDDARRVEPLVAQYDANVGRIAAQQRDVAAADEAFERALRRAPRDGRILLDAAEGALRLGQLAKADALLARLLGLYPLDGPAWWTQAKLRLAQGRLVEARAALEAALQADWRDWPEGAEVARQQLAVVLVQTGDAALARTVLEAPAPSSTPDDICGAPRRLELRDR